MLDALKVLFILTGASTYLVTKYIRVGVDDRNETSPYFEHEDTVTDTSVNKFRTDPNGDGKDLQQYPFTTVSSRLENEYSTRSTTTFNTKDRIGSIRNASHSITNHHTPTHVPTKLDSQLKKDHKYRVISSEDNGNITTAVFHISDNIQDNPSTLGRPTFEIEITEEDQNVPQRLLQVTVSGDHPSNSQKVIYTLKGEGMDLKSPQRSKFAINATYGDIYATVPLDRDPPRGRPQWKFAVYAHDSRRRSLVGYADVIVNLKDINDNSPYFPLHFYHGNITENGPINLPVMQMQAIDIDDPKESGNAKISYSIQENRQSRDSRFFTIDPTSGVIRTAVCCLNREQQQEYTFMIIATDGGGLKGSTTVTISIDDTNDSPPRFSQREYRIEIDEMNDHQLPQTPILVVSVNDADLSITNHFIYKIISDSQFISEHFSLLPNPDPSSASLRILRSFDYEDPQQRLINLTLAVSDNDNLSDSSHTDYTTVIIHVRDVNDNAPSFVKSPIKVIVPEDIQIGSVIAKFRSVDDTKHGSLLQSVIMDNSSPSSGITGSGEKIPEIIATDGDDSANGNGSPFTFKIDPSAADVIRDSFKVLHDSNGRALLYSRVSFDREMQKDYFIPIVIKDNGHPPLTGTSTLTIVIGNPHDDKSNNFGFNVTAIAALTLCLINIPLILVIILVYSRYNRRRNDHHSHSMRRTLKSDDKDTRENIVAYTDEGGGEDDVNCYDMNTLRIQITPSTETCSNCSSTRWNKPIGPIKTHIPKVMIRESKSENLADIIRDHLEKVDSDCLQFDEIHLYTYEGSGNTVGSLSSISSDKYEVKSDGLIQQNNSQQKFNYNMKINNNNNNTLI